MELFDLKQNILNNKFAGLYILYGPEYSIINAYIEKISNKTELPIKLSNSVADIINNLKSNNIFKTNYIYVIRNDSSYTSSVKAWNTLKFNQSKNIVILTYTTMDKRTKFYNEHIDFAVEFEKLSDQLLQKYIMKDYGLNESNALRVINRCDLDYGKIQLACEKLKILAIIHNKSINEIYNLAIEDNLIPISTSNLTLDMLDAFSSDNIDLTWLLLDILKRQNEPSLKILAMIYNSMKTTMLVQSCDPKSNISQKTGLDSWLIGKTKPYLNIYRTKDLVNGLSYIRNVERGLKTGGIDESIAIESALVNFYFGVANIGGGDLWLE